MYTLSKRLKITAMSLMILGAMGWVFSYTASHHLTLEDVKVMLAEEDTHHGAAHGNGGNHSQANHASNEASHHQGEAHAAMIEAFKKGEDIHASTASKVFNVPLSKVNREQRSNAKTVNFGIIYGVSAFGLSNQTDLSRTEAKELIDTYFATYPKLSAFIADQIDFAREEGYVKTISDRRRYLKDINSRNAVVRGGAERNAVNAPIQGSAADIIKIAMIHIHNKLQEGNYKTKMLLQVHDELVFDVHKAELETVKALIKTEMESAYKMLVPLDVDMDIGENWLEAH